MKEKRRRIKREIYSYNPYEYDIKINQKVETLDDLIELGEMYPNREMKRYNVDLYKLYRLVPALRELKAMIGMKKVKQNIINLIVFQLQELQPRNNNMMHTVIEGSPGCGKTELGKILAKIYLALDLVDRDYFKVVRRADLIAEYMGQTAIKTQKVLDKARGGVLFIDEAYSLGSPELRDSYSKECIDTINQHLTEEKDKFILIIAGYKASLKESFFAVNQGLERRFPFRYEVDEYDGGDLFMIFKKMVADEHWDLATEGPILPNFFVLNRAAFKFNGGDIETLFQMTKIAHARRVFTEDMEHKKKLNADDLATGFKMFQENGDKKTKNTDSFANLYL